MSILSRRSFMGQAARLGAVSTLGFAACSQASRPPNIVLIVADDLGYGDLGCYGQKQIRTPNVDRLAAEGLRFTDAYAGCTVCAPSRSVLMTGYHMGHTSVRGNDGGLSLAESDVTLAMLLKDVGYATGGYGKWGLGDRGSVGAPPKKGFDEFVGYLNQRHAHNYYPKMLVENEDLLPLPENENGKHGTYSQDLITERALGFIERNAERPFFCYMPMTLPHWELLVPEDSFAEYRGKFPENAFVSEPPSRYASQPEMRAAYAGMITRMDRDVGRVMDLVQKLGQEENTLFIFTSDNGAAGGIIGEDYFLSSGGFRGHKQNLYEGGIRTPMIARMPGRVAAGTTSSLQWSFCDMLPTLTEFAGAKTPEGIDGISILPTILGKPQDRKPEWLYWELPRWSVNGGFRDEVPMQAARNGDWKIVRPGPDAPLELYNLRLDRTESNDLALKEPQVFARMEAFLKTARTQPRELHDPKIFYFD